MEKLLKQVKKQSENDYLFFSDSLRQIISNLSLRSQEIVLARFGIFNSKAMTLEDIGKKYHITRERVRQIIHEALRKVKEKKNEPLFLKVQENIIFAIRSNGGIMNEEKLLAQLGNGSASEKAAIKFFLECMDDIVCHETKEELKPACMLLDFSVDEWRKAKNIAVEILKSHKRPLLFDDLFKFLNKSNDIANLPKEIFACYIEVSREIKKNAFGKWGIAEWKEISPKGTRGKAYLVLKETEKPLHFREIAEKIDQYRLNKKKTHPQTVHNELIKDNDFVLVGRGIYALVEWGYKKGTVKDVIEEILKNSSHPLKREEIIAEVLKIRQVKKSTIVINLNNYFSKAKNGTYSIKK